MKYTFIEFISACESEDFDKIESKWLDWGKKFVTSYPLIMEKEYHGGDCTRESYSCPLCLMETLLSDYKEYNFNEEKWREENGV